MKQEIVQVDAFTNTPFKGNPAALCVLERPADVEWMQALANEMNLSETAYLVPENNGYRLRWFTPAVEVKLCGHATVAAAHLLYEEGHVQPGAPCIFHTLSGELTARKNGDWIEVSFPAKGPKPAEVPAGLAEALGLSPLEFGVNDLNYGLVVVETEGQVNHVTPNFNALEKLPHLAYTVTARSDDKPYAFISRFFAPKAGVNEDPVTGSAHCLLAPYWARKLQRTEMLAYQASQRGGVVRTRIEGDRVILGGQAVTVMRGVLTV